MRRIVFIIMLGLILGSCKENNDNKDVNLSLKESPSTQTQFTTATENEKNVSESKVTFIELGSVNCIPCKMMQPVMKKVEEKYNKQVKVVFYDVWTAKDAPMSEKYQIKIIPTQIFLDSKGKEYFRHEGFFPFEDLEKILKQKDVK